MMRHLAFVAVLASAGCSTYEDFLDQKNDKFCDVWATCNTSFACELPEETVADTGCDFDRGAARQCLNGTWICEDDVPGFEYPLPPEICNDVCR